MNNGNQVWARIRSAWRGAAAAWAQNSTLGTRRTIGDTSSPQDLTEVLEHSADWVMQAHANGDLRFLNPAAREVLGLSPHATLRPLNLAQFAATGTRRQIARVILPALHAKGVWVGETALRLGNRRHVPCSLMALAHRGAQGEPIRYSAVLRDISADVQARQQIQRQNDILSAITEALPATVVIVDSQGCYRFVNSAFERLAGRPAHQILGRTAMEVLGDQEVRRRRPFMKKALAGEAVDFVLDYPGEHGTTYLALNCIPLKLDGVVDGFVGISQDITAQRREQERLTHLAERDPLTGLLNRAGFEQFAVYQRSQGKGPELALLYIDLDHFKPVNDRLGHLAGDRLLQMFARRLASTVRAADAVARLGGDEFAILLAGGADLASAEAVAQKVLAAAAHPFDMDGHAVKVSASVGVAVVPRSQASLRELMLRADGLLYRAKAAGRNRHCAQSANLDSSDQAGDKPPPPHALPI